MLNADEQAQIIETIARYNNASDRRDVEAHLAAYTDDGVISGGMGTTEGGKEGLRQALPAMFAAEGTAKRHLASNHEFDMVDADTATASYVLTVLEAETAPAVVATVWIVDTLQRVNDKWLVSEHRIAIDPSFQMPGA